MLTLSTGDGSSEVMAAVRSANAGNRRANDLEGEDLLTEFHWCAAYALRLGQFAGRLAPAMASQDHYEWPVRPKIPSRADLSGVSRRIAPMTPSPGEETLPRDAARWPKQCDRGQCFVRVEAAVVEGHAQTRREAKSSCGSSNWAKRSKMSARVDRLRQLQRARKGELSHRNRANP